MFTYPKVCEQRYSLGIEAAHDRVLASHDNVIVCWWRGAPEAEVLKGMADVRGEPPGLEESTAGDFDGVKPVHATVEHCGAHLVGTKTASHHIVAFGVGTPVGTIGW